MNDNDTIISQDAKGVQIVSCILQDRYKNIRLKSLA